MEKAPERCILCRTPERELLLRKGPWTVFRCIKCGFGFLDPRPSEDEIEGLYQSGYFSERYDKGLSPDSVGYKRRLSGETHRTQFIRKVKRSGHLLDVGCGYGYFMAASREAGYYVEGLDVSEWAAGHAIEKLDLPVTIGKLKDVGFPSHTFDIITMWHSLEHNPDPHLALDKITSWLKKDGILVIDVPNYKSTDAQTLWEEWDGWSLPYHFWHFTFQSLTRLLSQHGLKVIRSKDYHSEVVKERLRRMPFTRPFARLTAKMYSGTSIAVISKFQNEA